MTNLYSNLFRITALLVLIAILPGKVLAGPKVVLISGTGYEPGALESGNEISVNTLVSADKNTIIVLAESWRVDGNKNCTQYVIIRGKQYRVPSETPEDCEKTGSGNELGQAMQGKSTLAKVRALWFGDSKADSVGPENFNQLNEDLIALNEQVQRQPQYPVRLAPITNLSLVTAGISAPPPIDVDAQKQRIDEERKRQLREQQKAEREAELKRENKERKEAARQAELTNRANPESECLNDMRPSLVEYKSGMSWWNPEKVKRLCAGTLVGDQPRKCFRVVMSGRMETSGSHTWNMDQALELCRGTSDARRTIGCFSQLYKNKVAVELAINACAGGGR